MQIALVALSLLCASTMLAASEQPLTITWTNNMLRIAGPNLPGEFVEIWYLEAFCRSGSTRRDWNETTIPHRTELLSATSNTIRLKTRVEPSVVLEHEIRSADGVVDFKVGVKNEGSTFADVQWFQPCMRVDRFTGRKQSDYHQRSFIFTEKGVQFLHELPREEDAIYKGGQVYVPAGIPMEDVNPRPISRIKPVNNWTGCVSADNKWVLATAWSDTQELFQGVIVCLHNDPRIGGLKPGEERELTGKVVVLPNEPKRLLDISLNAETTLFRAEPFTPAGSFTEGIEGPACDRDGNIYAVNFGKQQTIGRVTPNGSAELFVTLPGNSTGNGIVFDQQGMMFVADYVGHNVLRIDTKTRRIDVFAHNAAMNQPNDLAIAPDGTLYASDPAWKNGTGQLWRIDRDGTTTLLASDLGTSNGIEVSPDGKTLFVNESVQRNIWAWSITTNKTLTNKKLVRQFADYGFDGMRCDVDGNLYVTRHGKGTVVKMSPAGAILREIDVLGKNPSNLCFGGPDGRTIYVTEVEHTRLVRFRVDRPGLAWARWNSNNIQSTPLK